MGLKYRKKAKYSHNPKGNGVNRYRDWNNLRYWFRGVEKFAPWVRKIHFVTWGHIPDWLDTTNPKINKLNKTVKYFNSFINYFLTLIQKFGVERKLIC